MALRPILSTLRRHRTAAMLIVVEVAITTAIVCNALHLISQRLERLNLDSGLPETELVRARVVGGDGKRKADDVTALDLQALRAVPGVKSVALVNQVIYGQNSNNSSVRLEPGRGQRYWVAANYEGSEGLLATKGLKLVAGRDFRDEEYIAATWLAEQAKPGIAQVIINRALAEALFPGRSAVGEQIYSVGDTPSTVVGVVERLPHPYPAQKSESGAHAMLFPVRPIFAGGEYLLRVAPADRDAVVKATTEALRRVEPGRIVTDVEPLTEMRSRYYAQDRSMVWLMVGVCAAMLVITAFGIVGLASFWVQQRSRMIGVRRALGATRQQILGYFQLENALLTSAGIVFGLIGAYGINQFLMTQHELPRLPWVYAPVAALLLWALGQVAVLAPARRAAALPPSAVMRGA